MKPRGIALFFLLAPCLAASEVGAASLQSNAIVVGSVVNVRRGPSVDSPVLISVKKDFVLSVDPSARADDWVKVIVRLPDGRQGSGWVFAPLVKLLPDAGPQSSVKRPSADYAPPKDSVAVETPKQADTFKKSLDPRNAVIPGEEEQLWRQDMMRTERKKRKSILMTLGGIALIAGAAIVASNDRSTGYTTLSYTDAGFFSTAKLGFIGGAGLAGWGGYQWHRASQTLRELKAEGGLRGYGASIPLPASLRWSVTLTF